ncbi:N-acyl-D-amino-acid deacylase family protein [Streptomyces bohaiensis]|uniref:D-aminoacylase n=1 Tax=Streptomyces bohaiensis TaxID=1431344 RepID=A0ABX1C762_9ACTN|nr:D-aminoacylase [Streptomyces bohaiensis]NJQ15002.1 D-aminoacylase [Streptomyces bohaiensis]
MTPDLVLRGGTLIDGTGAAPRTADLAVTDGRITAVGPDVPGTARRVLDISGAVVTPGFIDLHSHADFTVMGEPRAETQLLQGVTTLVTGNCGFSPFPVVPEHAAELRALCGFLDDGLTWEWTTAAGWAAAVERLPLGVNLAPQTGHGALRVAAVGTDDRAPTDDELATMRRLMAETAADGVVGFSTGLIYPPGRYAATGELAALARIAADHGLLHSTHMRDESAHLAAAVEEAVSIARQTGVRLQISHLKAAGVPYWGTVGDALRLIDAARADGVDVAADQYPYTASSTTLTTVLPGYALDGGVAALLRRIADPEQRARLVADLTAGEADGSFSPDRVTIAEFPEGTHPDHARLVGLTVTEAAAALGTAPADTVLDLLAAHAGQIASIHHCMAEDDVHRVMTHPDVAVASDGWILRTEGRGRPHPRSFGTFARVLGHFTREKGVLALPEAVRKMTGLPASRLGWTDRGTVRPGAVADLAVFDPDAVTDTSTFADPWRTATGVVHTLVGGRLAVTDGRATDAGAGRVLLHGGTGGDGPTS